MNPPALPISTLPTDRKLLLLTFFLSRYDSCTFLMNLPLPPIDTPLSCRLRLIMIIAKKRNRNVPTHCKTKFKDKKSILSVGYRKVYSVEILYHSSFINIFDRRFFQSPDISFTSVFPHTMDAGFSIFEESTKTIKSRIRF
jgi:hypothetical protein